MKEFIKKYSQVTPLKITFFIILLALVLFFFDFPFLRFMELKTLDLRIASRGVIPAGTETVIAVIDEKSLSELGRWPWPRTTIARLLDRLKAAGAKAVGFDIVFSEPDDNSSLKTISELSAEMKKSGIRDNSVALLLNKKKATADTDAALAKAIARAQNVTLGYFFHLSRKDVAYLSEKEILKSADNITNSRYQIINALEKNPDDSALPKAYAPETNLKFLSAAAVNSGFFNMIPDTDGSMRWSPLVIKFGNNYYSSLPHFRFTAIPGLAATLAEFSGLWRGKCKTGRYYYPDRRIGKAFSQLPGAGQDFPALLPFRYSERKNPGRKSTQ